MQPIKPHVLASVTGAAPKPPAAVAPTPWIPCETSPRYESWLREHPNFRPGG